jgi:adenylate kinase
MKLSLLGPPGSGKGVYAERLSKDFRVPVISVGNLLREEVEKKSELGVKIKKYLDKGELAPDDIVLKMVKKNLEENVILDGFPRSITQVNVDIDKVASLTCSDEICIKRIMSRRICSKCNKIYNTITMKPKKTGVCDVCGGKLVSREDEKVIRERLKVFRRETMPVLEHYKKEGILFEIDAERSVDEVYRDIRKLFKP